MKTQALILFLFTAIATLSAQSPAIKNLQKQREEVTGQIKFLTEEIGKNKISLNKSINYLDLILGKIKAQQELLTILSNEIRLIDQEIQSKESQIQVLEKDLQAKKEQYVTSIQTMHKRKGAHDQLLFILSADDFTQSLRRVLYLKEYSNWQKEQAVEIIAQQDTLSTEKQRLEARKKDKEALSQTRRIEEDKLQKEEEDQRDEVAVLQKDSKKLQTELAQKQKQANALNKEIERIVREEIEAARKKAESQPDTERKAVTQGGYAMTKEELKLSADFSANRGKLPFPLRGQYTIVGRFGQQSYEGLKNVVFNSNGIEIRTTAGNSARSVFDGIVSRVFKIDGSQTSVIIRHGNYLTLYSYLENVFVKQGDKIKTGQEIGKIYNDQEKGTVLHFEIWKDTSKVNPEPWLNK